MSTAQARERAAIARLAEGLAPIAEGAEGLVVLGSGLGALVERSAVSERVPFTALAGMPPSRVPGHAGSFAACRLGGRRVLAQSGRVHRYEGHSPFAVARSARAAAALGARWCLLTNAAGALRGEWAPGTFMAIEDHLDLQGGSPLFTGEGGRATPYSPRGLEALERAALAVGERLERGVYAGGLGPAYETPAEIRLLRRAGADAVGMSTVAEATAAHAAGLLVAGLSCITNPAAGVTDAPLSHEEVLEAGAAAVPRLARLVEAAAGELGGR